MSRNYTDDELQGAIDKILRNSIDRLYGSLGNRRTDVVFSQVQDAAAGVFIAYPNAPYYVVGLATSIVRQFVQTSLSGLQDLDDTVRSTARRVQPIKNLSPLANARSALTALSGASSTRITSLTRITEVPAYQRFEQSSSRFLEDSGKSVRSGGNIVQTPGEAKARLAGLLSTVQSGYTEILRRVQLLAGAIEDFDALNLPATLSSFVISNSRDLLSQHYDELSGLDEDQRLTKMRDVVLDVLAARAAVRGFGALDPTVTFLYFSGTGSPYADADYPAVAAVLPAELYGPYAILGDTRLDVVVDGSLAVSVDVPESYVASLESFLVEAYEITAGVNDYMVVRTTAESDVNITLTAGATQSAAEVADDINATLGPTHPVVAEPYAIQPKVQGDPVVFSGSVGASTTVTRLSGDFSTLPQLPALGDWMYCEDTSLPANDGWYEVTDISGLPASFEATKEDLPNPVDSPAGTAIVTINNGLRAVRLTFKDSVALQSVEEGWEISLPVNGDAITLATINTLGFIADGAITSQRTTAENIVAFINDNPAIAPTGTARLLASQEFSAVYYTGVARSEPTDNQKAVVYKLREDMALTSLGGNDARFTGSVGELLVVGDIVAIRTTALNDTQNYGVVTAVSPLYFDAAMDDPVVPEAVVDVEVGPDLSGMLLPATVVLSDPLESGLNDGVYTVLGTGGLDGTGPEFELTLGRVLVAHTEAGYQPRDLGDALVGAYRLVLSSASTLLDTSVAVQPSSTAGGLFWSVLPASQVGTTEWFGLPEAPKGVEEGDYLEFRDTAAQGVSLSRTVVQPLMAPNILQVTPVVSTTLGTYGMAQDTPAPSGRVRKVRKDTYRHLKEQLDDWLDLPLSNANKYFADIRKLLNPLIVNANPTAVAVQEASNKVAALFSHLGFLLTYLEEYEAPLVEPVDRLLDTYVEQGADRARDLLLESSFSVFFNLTQDESSYSGDLQKSIREVNQHDLPISKLNRNPGGQLIDSYEERDYETDIKDSEGVEDVELTGESYEFPGSAF